MISFPHHGLAGREALIDCARRALPRVRLWIANRASERIDARDLETRGVRFATLFLHYHDTVSKPELTVESLIESASAFAALESAHAEPQLYGVTDGKAVGTYLEHKFRAFLTQNFTFEIGNSAQGIDFPTLHVDMKTTSIRQPQSSCPFRSGRQKIYGLGYAILVFVYEKTDDPEAKSARLDIQHVIYVDGPRTGDYQMTRGLREIIERDGNVDDLVALMADKNLPVDEIEMRRIAEDVIRNTPEQGYLTISNALQWRLQYTRVIEQAGEVLGVHRVK